MATGQAARARIKVVDCGAGCWDDHGLDIPHDLDTFNFRVTGTGHERIERIFQYCCADRRNYAAGLSDRPLEQRIAKWICLHACSFVLFDTKPRATVIGFERLEDAHDFSTEFLPPHRSADGSKAKK